MLTILNWSKQVILFSHLAVTVPRTSESERAVEDTGGTGHSGCPQAQCVDRGMKETVRTGMEHLTSFSVLFLHLSFEAGNDGIGYRAFIRQK